MNPTDLHRKLPDSQERKLEPGPELLRARLLQQTLNATAIGMGLFLLAGAYPLIRTQNWSLLGIAGIIYLLLLVTTRIKSSSYRLRAFSLLFACFAAGLISLLFAPYQGFSQLWLLCFTAFAVLFFGLGSGILAALFSGITLIGVGYTLTLGWVPVGISGDSSHAGLAYWLVAGLVFVLVALLFTAVQYNYTNGWASDAADLRQENFQFQSEQEYLNTREKQLEQRLHQLQEIYEISLLANRTMDPDQQAAQLIEAIQSSFDLDFVGILLADAHAEQAVLKAASSREGARMVVEGFQLPVGGTSAIGLAMTHGKPRILRKNEDESTPSDWPYLPESSAELILPLSVDKRMIGAISLHSTQIDAFDEDNLDVYQNLADALAAAIDNANQFQDMQSKLAESESLNRQYLLSAWNNQITDYIRKQYTYEKPGFAYDPSSAQSHKTPLSVRDQVIGDLILESGEAPWTAEDIHLIDAVAAQTAQALENARLIQETQQKAFQEQLIGDFSSRIRESFNLDAMLRAAVRELGDHLNLAEVEAYIGWEDPEGLQTDD